MALRRRQLPRQLANLLLDREELLEVLLPLELLAPLLEPQVRLRLLLLALHVGALGGEALLLLVVVDLLLLRTTLLALQLLVLLLELVRARDLLEERRELLWRLGGELRDVSLEDEEAGVGLGEDAHLLQPLAVHLGTHRAPVHQVITQPLLGDPAGELGLDALRVADEAD